MTAASVLVQVSSIPAELIQHRLQSGETGTLQSRISPFISTKINAPFLLLTFQLL